MLSRRSIFSLFAGVGAIAAGAKVVEAAPTKPAISLADLPEYDPFRAGIDHPNCRCHWLSTAEMPSHSHSNTLADPTHLHSYTCTGRQYEAGECLPTEKSMGMMFSRGMLVSGGGLVPSVSDGKGRIVPVDSPEGQAILKSIAAPNAGMSRW